MDVGVGPNQQVAKVWVLGGWRSLRGLVLMTCHSHTGLDEVTDVGLKAFSAALGSSTTIATVSLRCKSEWLVTML